MSKTYEIDGATVMVASSLEDLAAHTDPDHVLALVSDWIDLFNAGQGETGTILPQAPDVLKAKMAGRMGVVLLEYIVGEDYKPIAFCGLSSNPVGEPLPDGILEIGSLIKAPQDEQGPPPHGLGVILTKEVLLQPAAQEAAMVYAYANPASEHVFSCSCEAHFGIGAAAMTEAELAQYPFLTPYAGDKIMDLTPVRDSLAGEI